jgi:hypothetical protein
MAKPFHELLAESLNRAHQVAIDGFVRSDTISRLDRERLLKGHWLQPIIQGWYLLVSPLAQAGESTAWYASFWNFIQQYLQTKFGVDYCLSAESSLDIHTGNNLIPNQVIVLTKKSGHYTLALPHHTSLLIYHDKNKFPSDIDTSHNIQLMPLGLALCKTQKSYFQNQPINANIALSLIRDPSELTRYLLKEGLVQSAGRLAGAYRLIGKLHFTEAIIQTMSAAGFSVTENNPFEKKEPHSIKLTQRITSPYYLRIIHLWETMRSDVINNFPEKKLKNKRIKDIIKHIDHVYANDAYNSLSIEGYKVSIDLIEKVKSGKWSPNQNQADQTQRDALAAKGYYLAFQSVKASLIDVLNGKDIINVLQKDLSKWYQALFQPSVEAGIIESFHLAGYRNDRVYIRHSLHTPPPKEAVLDCMDAFFYCLTEEKNPIVRAVLGHFIFVFIHPYMDGNGRIGRFIMNLLWCAAQYPWTIIRVESRQDYIDALEAASTTKNIKPFTQFLSEEMSILW